VPACVHHAPALADLSLAVNAVGDRKPPTTKVGDGGEEKRGLHAPTSEIHSLACTSHASVRGCSKGTQLVSKVTHGN
jgi:hypothetical protein